MFNVTELQRKVQESKEDAKHLQEGLGESTKKDASEVKQEAQRITSELKNELMFTVGNIEKRANGVKANLLFQIIDQEI